MSYRAANRIIKTRAEIARLGKRVFLNLFRHSSATETANFLTEAQLKKRHGWTKDSKMAGRYTHLVNADVESAILKHHGIVLEETNLKPPKICQVCSFVNDPESSECSNCDKPLDLKTALEIQEKEQDGKQREIEDLKENMDKIIEEKIGEYNQKFMKNLEKMYDEQILASEKR